MTQEQLERWTRIRHHRLDAPGAAFPLSARLAHEQGWTPVFTERVVEEYRRFAFLAVVAGHGVTPSKAVDEAWHLHLLYTRDYWERFCPEALGQPLHHHPSDGGGEDDAKYAGWYAATLASYRRIFGEAPPADVWPSHSAPGPKARRGWRLLLPFATILAGCAEPANLLDWQGPAFLGLYTALLAAAGLTALVLRWALTGSAEGPSAADWRLSVEEQAALNGGGGLALVAALARLVGGGALEVDRKTRRFRAATDESPVPLHRTILRAAAAPGGAKLETIQRRAGFSLGEMEATLRRRRLWVEEARMPLVRAIPFAVFVAPLLLGGAKVAVGLSRGRPVGFLLLECALGLGLALAFLVPPKRSRYGDRVLAELRDRRPSSGDLALGVALFGLVALEGTAHADLRAAIVPVGDASGSGGASGCGSGCGGGGSSCGGGGCGGGGCGGCGG